MGVPLSALQDADGGLNRLTDDELDELSEDDLQRIRRHIGHEDASGPPSPVQGEDRDADPSLVPSETTAHRKPSDPEDCPESLEIPECAGDVLTLWCSNCGYRHPVPVTCGRRTCPDCARARYHELKQKYEPLQAHLREPKFVTVTLKRYPIGHKPERGLGWFVHLHALWDGPRIPQTELSEAWEEITGDSFRVDVRDCRQPESAVGYILGYTTAGPKIEQTWADVAEDTCQEFEEAIKGRRLLQTFGHLHGKQTAETEFSCPNCEERAWILLDLNPSIRELVGVPRWTKISTEQKWRARYELTSRGRRAGATEEKVKFD